MHYYANCTRLLASLFLNQANCPNTQQGISLFEQMRQSRAEIKLPLLLLLIKYSVFLSASLSLHPQNLPQRSVSDQ